MVEYVLPYLGWWVFAVLGLIGPGNAAITLVRRRF
jgi:hypothetical protein